LQHQGHYDNIFDNSAGFAGKCPVVQKPQVSRFPKNFKHVLYFLENRKSSKHFHSTHKNLQVQYDLLLTVICIRKTTNDHF